VVPLLFFKVFDIAFFLLDFFHFLLEFFLEAFTHFDNDEYQNKQTQNSNNDIEFGVLLSDSAGVIGIFDVKIVGPGLESGKRTRILVVANWQASFFSIVKHLY
jgi:hypothetical protein